MDGKQPQDDLLKMKINSLIERVFLITFNKDPPKAENNRKVQQLVYMEDVALGADVTILDMELLEQALFERIILPNPSDYLIPNNVTTDDTDDVRETQVVIYLFACYMRNEKLFDQKDSIVVDTYHKMKSLILRNACTAFKQPELFEGQVLSSQLLTAFKSLEEDQSQIMKFISETTKEIFADTDGEEDILSSMENMFSPKLACVMKAIKRSSLVNIEGWIMPYLHTFTSDKSNSRLACIFLKMITPPVGANGNEFSDTVLGQLLSISIMPVNHNGPYMYFENTLSTVRSAYDNLTSTLWSSSKLHLESVYIFIKSFLLMGGEVRNKMLEWIGRCLHANVPRGQIWNSHQSQSLFGSLTTAPDSFSINLAGVLLRLCQPLLKPQLKVLMVDPTYCAVKNPDKAAKGVHMLDSEKETCLLPVEEDEVRLEADKYNFVTECFFMTHKAIDLGFRVCIGKFFQMNREMNRLQGAYQDTLVGGGMADADGDLANNIKQMLLRQSQQFLCLQNLLLEPSTDQLLLQFYEASAIWLSQLASRDAARIDGLEPAKGYAPQCADEVQLPLTNTISKALKCIPEYIVENIVGYLQFSCHFDSQSLPVDVEAQNNIFTMILVFMGSSERIRNPHLRARLAEGLESLLPKESEDRSRFRFSAVLFTNHVHRLEIIPNLLRVFVSIEMTGQSVQFEQKFNYRRPMYAIMDYLWKIDEQKQCFRELEREAIVNIEAEDPPIFLRFINLLINDAIFLLDESLSNLQQIRQLQAAQDAGEWTSLPSSERQQNLVNLRHLGMLARFDNILGRDTINILQLLTSETKEIFCHSSMVDRVAAMLNYFLLNLTGPKKGNFKVKDKKEFEFDPARTVLEICRIYVNLQECSAFCLAVSQDGRSYSPQLFEYAEQVLTRIGGGQLIGEIQEFSARVQELDAQQKIDEEALIDPPEEFLDPIMSSLMTDPVILPSSRNVVDRSTIARHLLSDQSDPFNRSPLTMDQVKRDVELKARIEEWIRDRRAQHIANRTGEAAVGSE
ncbi:ubiquitin conjugation factor E4 A [Toxorhynchites rutilus septentrionalis]|uniref:ubiquitin conjugation factor E4 A n=1 Tax=Toxorhynchites rutilus septentrionalis TaxID=329112 RepID=UPI00247A3ABB|nr:ubiquitin conjugation factor E4 A [Toxorhynchites rutilus septentrionalis]